MIFRYVQEKVNQNGSTERLVTDFAQSELTFGRGGDSHVIFASQRVSMVHAKMNYESGALVVTDQGSLAGVRVNGRRVARANVKSGDVIQLGDINIKVDIRGDVVELVATIPPPQTDSEVERVSGQLERLRIEHYLPSMSVLLIVITVVGVLGFLVYPFAAKNFSSWNSGPISNSHKLIEGDCKKCHSQPFTQVQDKDCISCHNLTEHSKDLTAFHKTHPNLEVRCAQCHMEHNGDAGLISKDAAFCTSCHANITKLKKDASVLDVVDFASHPQFRVSVKDSNGSTIRVNVDDGAKAVDSAQIKLNHALHLKEGLRGKDGPVTLQCNACHQVSPNFKSLEPIRFDKHCRDCHSLGFDERLADSQVPHGDSEAVYPALFTEYTKLLLLNEGKTLPNPARDQTRMLPGGTALANPTPRPVDAALVASSARAAEKELFTKTGCFLCHSFTEKPEQLRTDTNSHYDVTKPEIPDAWFTKARFSHGAHEEFSCESCHEKTRKSTKTTDILLPGKKLCQDCHGDGPHAKTGFVTSGCAECHSYHDPLGIPAEKKHSIADYLKTLTR